MKLFSADTAIIFGRENIKKLISKVAYVWQIGFLFLYSPNYPKHPRIECSFYRFLYPSRLESISNLTIFYTKACMP